MLLQVGEKALLDLVSDQYALTNILKPFLKTDGLDFVGPFVGRWWPMGKRAPVMLDARRNFGQPIVKEGIPTIVLYRAARAEQTHRAKDVELELAGSAVARPSDQVIRYVADWYLIPPRSVRAAIDYEMRLAA